MVCRSPGVHGVLEYVVDSHVRLIGAAGADAELTPAWVEPDHLHNDLASALIAAAVTPTPTSVQCAKCVRLDAFNAEEDFIEMGLIVFSDDHGFANDARTARGAVLMSMNL